MDNSDRVVSSDFLKVLLALKSNIMKDLHVATICKVNSIKVIRDANNQALYTLYDCISINNANCFFICFALKDLDISINSYALVLFCDEDNLINYKRIKTNELIKDVTSENKHSYSYGVIIGLI